VAFDPERTQVQKTLVKYEWRETLRRKGIINCGQEGRNRLWDEGQYAPLPAGVPGELITQPFFTTETRRHRERKKPGMRNARLL
jgi:hypothetical protein